MSLTLLKSTTSTICTYAGSFHELLELLNNLRASGDTGTLHVHIMTGGVNGMVFEHKEHQSNLSVANSNGHRVR